MATSPTSSVSPQLPVCPVGEAQCEVIDELVTLRAQNVSLQQQAHVDSLTGLYNRRYLIQALEREMERTRRTARPTAVVIADLDHFKQVNDNWGHETGDRALQLAADMLRASVRKLDIACRYGGEEFVVILPDTELPLALSVAERIRAMIEAQPLSIATESDSQEALSLTASLGVEAFDVGSMGTAEQLIGRADAFLYQAKHQGRNCVRGPQIKETAATTGVSDEEKDALFDMLSELSDQQ